MVNDPIDTSGPAASAARDITDDHPPAFSGTYPTGSPSRSQSPVPDFRSIDATVASGPTANIRNSSKHPASEPQPVSSASAASEIQNGPWSAASGTGVPPAAGSVQGSWREHLARLAPAAPPVPGDIVMAFVPRYDNPNSPGPSPVPCLVIAVRDPGHNAPHEVAIVPGGTRGLDRTYRGELLIDGFEGLSAAGLRGPRKFDLRAPQAMNWDPTWFSIRNGSASLGHLSDTDMNRAVSAQADAVRAVPGLAALPPLQAAPPGLPRPGDVVMAFAPHPDAPDQPGPFARPCLVLDVGSTVDSNGKPQPTIRMVPSSNNLERSNLTDLLMVDDEGMRAAGITQPRKFAMNHAQEIPWRADYLSFPNGEAVLGHLAPRDMSRAVQAYGRACNSIRALPDIPAMLPAPPEPGDVLYAFCPFDDAPNMPGPKPRPCVVLDVREVPGPKGPELAIHVAPATSQKIYAPRPGELVVDDDKTMMSAGLTKQSKFRFGETSVIRWKQGWLYFRDGGPRLGRLPEAELQKGLDMKKSLGRSDEQHHPGMRLYEDRGQDRVTVPDHSVPSRNESSRSDIPRHAITARNSGAR